MLVMAHEMTKRSQEALSGTANESTSRVSSYRKAKQQETERKNDSDTTKPCHGCGSKDHGASFQDPKEKCPAWGKTTCPCKGPNHFKRACRRKGVPVNQADGTTQDRICGESSMAQSGEGSTEEREKITCQSTSSRTKRRPGGGCTRTMWTKTSR